MVLEDDFVLFGYSSLSFFLIVLLRFIGGLFYSEMIGEIVGGIILGPNLIDIIPYSNAIIWIGKLGLILLIIDAGINFEIKTVKEQGLKVILAATTGVLFVLFFYGFLVLLSSKVLLDLHVWLVHQLDLL